MEHSVVRLNLKDTETAKRVLELQIASYRVEAELIGFDDIPPLKDTIDSLKGCDEVFWGCLLEGALAGIVSYKVKDAVLDIHRVAVHPRFFRRGIGEILVNHVETVEGAIDKVVVCTGKKNVPAVSLYLKRGYKKAQDFQIDSGIYVTAFEKFI